MSITFLQVFSFLYLVCCCTHESIIEMETDHWSRALNEMKLKNIKLKGFYHASSWAPYWRDVLIEQLFLLDGKRVPGKWSNNPLNISDMDISHMYQTKIRLLENTEQLYLNIVGPTFNDFTTVKEFVDSLNLTFKDNIHFNYNKTLTRGEFKRVKQRKDQAKIDEMLANKEISEGESSTVMTLYNYCKNEVKDGRSSYVYYMHSKGGCCVRGKNIVSNDVEAVASWREVMNTFNIEFPSICLRALNLGYSACGMEYQGNPLGHYSGNFW